VFSALRETRIVSTKQTGIVTKQDAAGGHTACNTPEYQQNKAMAWTNKEVKHDKSKGKNQTQAAES